MTSHSAMLERLFAAALAARRNAHAPYSGFAVGAAVEDEAGRLFAGCNVENAAYPAGTCAEEAAIAAMVAAGGRRLAAVLVVGGGPALISPCGACRQRIREFGAPATPIHLAGLDGIRASHRLEDLLPLSFGPESLGPLPGGSPTA